jgi:hypothetical protein
VKQSSCCCCRAHLAACARLYRRDRPGESELSTSRWEVGVHAGATCRTGTSRAATRARMGSHACAAAHARPHARHHRPLATCLRGTMLMYVPPRRPPVCVCAAPHRGASAGQQPLQADIAGRQDGGSWTGGRTMEVDALLRAMYNRPHYGRARAAAEDGTPGRLGSWSARRPRNSPGLRHRSQCPADRRSVTSCY